MNKIILIARNILIFVLTFLVQNPGTSQPTPVKPAVNNIIQAFDFGEVQLLPGLMYDQFREVKKYFMGLSNDDMLHVLRMKEGIPDPPGKAIGGWYDMLSALTLPQWISAYCRLYAVSGEPACKEKADYLFDEWWKYYTRADNSGSNDKWVMTLLDMDRYCNRPDALEKLNRYILGGSQAGSGLAGEGGYISRALRDTIAAFRKFGDNSSEWYTAGWPLYLAYLRTGNKLYKACANFWEYREWWDLFASIPVKPFFKTPVAGLNSEWVHAYSHINSFNAAAEAYRVKGDPYYLNAMKNLYDWMMNYQIFATGGFGPELEHLMPMDRVEATLSNRTDHFETQCGSWAALMLCQNLITLTGEARYGNWIERLAYNAINATIPMTPETNVLYYSNYNLNRASKLNRPIEGTCCAGTRPLTVMQYFINTYYHDNDILYVNLFTPSSVTWKRAGNRIKLTQNTLFPYSGSVNFTLELAKAETFGIGFRIPEWLAASEMHVKVNGKGTAVTARNGWLIVDRSWHTGDRLELDLALDFWLNALDKGKGKPTAIMYGPLVMALTSGDGTLASSRYNQWWSYEGMLPANPDKKVLDRLDPRAINSQAVPDGKPLEFRITGTDLLLKPFMNFGKGELYYLYLDQ